MQSKCPFIFRRNRLCCIDQQFVTAALASCSANMTTVPRNVSAYSSNKIISFYIIYLSLKLLNCVQFITHLDYLFHVSWMVVFIFLLGVLIVSFDSSSGFALRGSCIRVSQVPSEDWCSLGQRSCGYLSKYHTKMTNTK